MTRNIQQLPNNSGSTSIVEVATNTGFNAGDPVYFTNGDYKPPSGLTTPSSVNFGITANLPLTSGSIGGIISPAFSQTQQATSLKGGSRYRFASTLTNGNIVQVWINYSTSVAAYSPCFRIINTSGTVVVSPTTISSTYGNASYSCISVVALTGGGFAVAWSNDRGGTISTINYAIYTNTGTVTTTAQQDTSFSLGTSNVAVEMVALANGGFAIAAKNTSNQILLRSYNATGTGAYGLITSFTAISSSYQISFALTARSDNSVFVCDLTTTSAYSYALYNSSGGTIVGTTVFSIPNSLTSPYGSVDASVLSDGTTIVIAYSSYDGSGNTTSPAFRFLPTGNTISSNTLAIPVVNTYIYRPAYGCYSISVLGLSAGGFVIVFADGQGIFQYAFFNSSGTPLTATNSSGAVAYELTGAYLERGNKITLLETSGYVNVYFTSQTGNGYLSINQFGAQIDKTSYQPLPVSYISGTAYTFTGQTPGSVATSSITPNTVSYLASSTSTSLATSAIAEVVGPTTVNSSASDSIACCTLPNGQFVIAYRDSSYYVYANVYSTSGALLKSISVGQGYATSGYQGCVRVAPLSTSKFVVAWLIGGSTTSIGLSLYSTGYGLISRITLVNLYSGYTQALNFDVAGLQNDTYAISYPSGSTTTTAAVYDGTNTLVWSTTFSFDFRYISITSNSYGGFAIMGFYSSGGNSGYFTYNPLTSTSWQQTGANPGAFSQGTTQIILPQCCATPSGTYIFPIWQSTANTMFYLANDSYYLGAQYTVGGTGGIYQSGNSSSFSNTGVGLTGNGNALLATVQNASQFTITCIGNGVTYTTNGSIPTQGNTTTFSNQYVVFTGKSCLYSSGYGSQIRVTPSLGNNAVICWLDASSYPTFGIYTASNSNTAYILTSGVTPSSPVSIAPIPTSTTIGGILAGVAVTSATAGSTGQVAINGQAQLGSSYTSTASGAFDYTGNAVSGVRGTFNGKLVNLQGNT
jgi:hypothetical protein